MLTRSPTLIWIGCSLCVENLKKFKTLLPLLNLCKIEFKAILNSTCYDFLIADNVDKL